MKWGWIAFAVLLPSAAMAQQPMDVTVVKGACQAGSNRAGSPYSCDDAIFAFFDNANRHIMIQFDKKGDDSIPLLGFAGTMEDDGVTLDVDRIYLEPGKPQAAEKSSCKLSFTKPASADAQVDITGIACSGQVSGQSGAVEVVFKPAATQ